MNFLRLIGTALLLTGCGSAAPTQANMAAAEPVGNISKAAPSAGDLPVDASAKPQEKTIDRTNQTGVAVLRELLVADGMLDGSRITDVKLDGRCVLVVSAASGEARIDWRGVDNYAGRTVGDRRVFTINDGNAGHSLAVSDDEQPEPLGNVAARLDSALGVLADTCQS